MAVAASQAGAGWRSSLSNSSTSVCGKQSSCCSRQHFPFPDVAMSVWPSGGVHSVAKVCRLRGARRCRVEDESERSEKEQGNVADESMLLEMKTVSARKLEEYIDKCKGSDGSGGCDDESWKSWQEYFPKVEEEGNLISALKFQLDDAVKSENFQEAAKLKKTLEAATASDVLLEVNQELQRALKEERYGDAARIRDEAGAGLVGWWAGVSKTGNDPFGRIINVKAAYGRLIAKTYTARQLGYAAQRAAQLILPRTGPKGLRGNALFEVFVKKDERGFNKQVVYLQREKSAQEATSAELDKVVKVETAAPEKKVDGKKDQKSEDDSDKDQTYDEANDIVEFMKDRIPDIKMKVIKVTAPEGSEPDIPKIIEEIIQNEEEQRPGDDIIGGVVIEDQAVDGTPSGDDKKVTVKVLIGEPSASDDDANGLSRVRVPATISQETKDCFVLHVDSIRETKTSEADLQKLATAAARTSTERMPDDLQKLWNVEKMPAKASKELKEVIRLAVAQAQGSRTLPKTTVFHRVDTDCTDPFAGLYVGTFGANIPEIIQLKRKYGHWDTEKPTAEDKLKFYEYVEAVKLTGDMNVPAGQVSFRARIGKEHKQSPAGVYPEELGVVARYKGQGHLADPGFQNPKWTDGELVLLSGRKSGPAAGAKLGFVFHLPDHHFLILFDRLNLEEICRG